MAFDQRQKNSSWNTRTETNYFFSDSHYHMASLATLMDIRDSLQALHRILSCHNCLDIPNILKTIEKNTKRRSKKSSGRQ